FNYPQGEKSKLQTLDLKDSSSLKLGANVVALGGKESGNVVSTGIVTEFSSYTGRGATSTDVVSTDLSLSSDFSGWLLFDTGGNLVGLEIGSGEGKSARFLNAAVIKSALAGLL